MSNKGDAACTPLVDLSNHDDANDGSNAPTTIDDLLGHDQYKVVVALITNHRDKYLSLQDAAKLLAFLDSGELDGNLCVHGLGANQIHLFNTISLQWRAANKETRTCKSFIADQIAQLYVLLSSP